MRRRLWLPLLLLLAGYVAFHIYRWGGPVTPSSRASGRQRVLILCLDGVPYSELAELWNAGHFRDFFRPVPLVSTFPSESEVAMTALFQAPAAPGYENLFFDRKKGEIAGGIALTLEQSAPYLKKLDYDEPGYLKGVHFIVPLKSFRADLGRFQKRFLASTKPVYFAHLSSTDALYHVYPPERVRPLLLELDAVLHALFAAEGGKLRILLFSDHGNNLVPSRLAPLRAALERAGFRPSVRLDQPRAVVIPQYGLVSFAAVYAQPAVVSELAAVLAAAEGVDVVAYRQNGELRVRSADGEAAIDAAGDGERFRYRALRGDPLRLLPILKQQDFLSEQDLFNATLDGPYPDALFRIFEWSNQRRSHVINRSDLMVSLADGYYWGSGFFEKFVHLQSTHGALGRRATLGFAMRTDAPLPRAQRHDELLTPYPYVVLFFTSAESSPFDRRTSMRSPSFTSAALRSRRPSGP